MFEDRQLKGFFYAFLVYIGLSIPIFLVSENTLHLALIWNLFLAYIPLMLAKVLQSNILETSRLKLLKLISLSVLWLLFFPNALYVITDFIHLSGSTFYWLENPYATITYSADIILWIRFVHIAFGAFMSSILGLLSFYIIHNILKRHFKKTIANSSIFLVCLLSGYAIYIGRFLRFNSWDILQPITLINQLIENMNIFTLQYSFVFAIYILACYSIFYLSYERLQT